MADGTLVALKRGLYVLEPTLLSSPITLPLGRFAYERLSMAVYLIGITRIEDNQDHHYLIAPPEKALCDKLMLTANLGITSVTLHIPDQTGRLVQAKLDGQSTAN